MNRFAHDVGLLNVPSTTDEMVAAAQLGSLTNR
jgi:hypothetical protein